MIGQLDPGGNQGPAEQERQQQHQDGAVIEREQRVIDTLAGRQFPAQILLDEIHQRDDDFRDQHRDDDHRKDAVNFEPAEHEEQQRVEEIAYAVELQFLTLRGAPGEPLGQFMMIERVEGAHRDLNADQGPKQRRHDAAPRNTADWRISGPMRG